MSTLSKLSLLFVEDDSETRDRMRRILEDRFREYYEAECGEQGLERYRRHRPDLILSDIAMPRLDGIEMVRKIRREDREQVILLLSAYDDRKTLINVIEASVDGFISKPILDLEEFFDKLEKAAELHLRRRDMQRKKEAERERLFHRLYYQANHDPLTGIPNRHFFLEKLREMLSGEEPGEVTLFFIDLDNLKKANDRYGHAAGDAILRTLASRLETLLPEGAVLARIGGDEFVIALKREMELRDRITFAEEILERSTRPFLWREGIRLEVGCSIGIFVGYGDERDPEELIHYADMAMYRAKKEGKGGYRIFEEENGSSASGEGN
jgi:diguanylate cyclase (GGDEF)-like protein